MALSNVEIHAEEAKNIRVLENSQKAKSRYRPKCPQGQSWQSIAHISTWTLWDIIPYISPLFRSFDNGSYEARPFDGVDFAQVGTMAVSPLQFCVHGLGCKGLGFGVWGLWFWGLGFGV